MAERNVLVVSIAATIAFAVMGVVWGIIAGSGMIIFDGLYSLVSVGLSSISLLVLKQVNEGESDRFPFGKSQFEPMLVALKSVTIIGMCVYAAFDSFSLLFKGGRPVEMGSALIYSIVGFLGCGVVTLFLHFHGKKSDPHCLKPRRINGLAIPC